MPVDITVSHNAALQVIQQAALSLARWANPNFQQPPLSTSNSTAVSGAVATAQQIVGWSDTLDSLQLVFDTVHLSSAATQTPNYRPAWALDIKGSEVYPRIPYAQSQPPNAEELAALKAEIANTKVDWENLAQLTLFVEKFGSHLSAGVPDIALIDLARSTAAIAAALAQQPKGNQLALIGGDLMGVQKFIYTISSEGALKSLRARSFYLELAAEEVVQQLLTKLDLPRTNVIYAGASKFYLLIAVPDGLKETLQQIQNKFNDWLLETFQRKVFLAIAHTCFPAEQLKAASDFEQTPLTQIWQQVNDCLSAQAFRKFEHQLDKILKPQPSHQPCKVCHRDDVPEEQLKLLSNFPGEDSVLACPTCRLMFTLGDRLPEVKALVRSSNQSANPDDSGIQVERHYYRSVPTNYLPKKDEIVFQINNWDLNSYPSNQSVPLLLGNYFARSKETKGFISASEMADAAAGRVGYLRMDVDRLSQIFSKGLGKNYTLPRLACLSRQMTYFFKVYLNSLADCRQANFTEHKNADGTSKFKTITPLSSRKNLLFIYAGGDDLFVSGAWNETVEFAFDVYQSFRAYTGQHPDITLSGGIGIAGAKFPLYQAAKESGDVEKAAKGNGRDSLGLFNATLKWAEWLGTVDLEVLKSGDREYLESVDNGQPPALFGVLPFVERLYGEVGQGYTRSFVRNLLNTAQMQEAKIKEAKEKYPNQVQDIRYYLHLPKVAYTLARLPDEILTDADFRKSLKSPYNAPYFRAIATWIELLNRSA